MKKIYNLWILALILIGAGACTSEVDDVFDQSAANRINQSIAEYQEVLRSAGNGWVLNYYPAATKAYGGYTMLIRFHKEGTADVSCDLFQPDKVSTGAYDMVNSAGPMLTFSTYNEIFHFFSEPSNALGIGEDGMGMEGDSDFLILSCTSDEVVLKGKKTGNKMIMHPLPENVAWEDYLQSVKQITNEAYPAAYEVVIDGVIQYTVTQRYRKFILENADGSQVNLPFHYTPEGISFDEPLSLATLDVKELRWEQGSMSFTDDKVTIRARELPKTYSRYEKYIGEYFFVYYQGNTMLLVTLEEELFNESYLMKGLPFDMRIRYNAVAGSISLEYQMLPDGIVLVPWTLQGGGYLSQTQGVGMEGYMEEKAAPNPGDSHLEDVTQTVILQDNGMWGKFLCDSFVAIDNNTGKDVLQLAYVTGFFRTFTQQAASK
jgi:hypothetical protein